VPRTQNKVVIYSSSDQVRNSAFLEMLSARFPEYNIDIIFMPGGTHGSRLIAEGNNTHADISVGLEVSYLRQVRNILADLSEFDFRKPNFMPDLLDHENNYFPWEIISCVVAVNYDLLNELQLPIPSSYEDLLDPKYNGLISMPNPRSSSAGHIFLAFFVDKLGEEDAFDYFDKLAQNVNQFQSAGSGVMTALINRDIAIGLTVLHNAVSELSRGSKFALTFFNEQAPSSLSGATLTKRGSRNKAALGVFEYLINEVSIMDKQRFSPGRIFVDQVRSNDNYPIDVPYKLFILDQDSRDYLLDRWRF